VLAGSPGCCRAEPPPAQHCLTLAQSSPPVPLVCAVLTPCPSRAQSSPPVPLSTMWRGGTQEELPELGLDVHPAYIGVAEPNDLNAHCPQEIVARPAPLLCVGRVVHGPIDFDRDSRSCAVEIHDYSTLHELTPELQPKAPPVAQNRPHRSLGGCWGASHLACESIDQAPRLLPHAATSDRPGSAKASESRVSSPLSTWWRGGQGVRAAREGDKG
jgi:hypothetical protein